MIRGITMKREGDGEHSKEEKIDGEGAGAGMPVMCSQRLCERVIVSLIKWILGSMPIRM